MEAPIPTPTTSVKTIEVENNGKKLKCKIQIIEESLEAKIFLDCILIYKGIISLPQIQSQTKILLYFNINEIFEEISLLNANNFSLIKESNKMILKIKFVIMGKEFNLFIDLKEINNKNLSNDELINYYENIIQEKDSKILELKEIIQFKDEKIKALEDQIKNMNNKGITKKNNKNDMNYILYNDFNIKLKEPIHKLNVHTSYVYCLSI